MKKSKKNQRRVKKYSLIIIPDNRAKIWRWDVSRKKVEALFGLCLTVLFVLTGSIWGFAHYRESYLATEDIRLQNAKFEEERFELLTKVANLEEAVEKTQRFAGRLENEIGINPDEIQKGIGPIIEHDFSEPASVKKFNFLKVSPSNKEIAFSSLDSVIEGVKENIASVDDRLQTVYEFQQDKITYWASIPSIWPTQGWITSDFGPRRRPIRGGTRFHKGIDIAAPSGTPILAPGDGIVTFSGYKRGYGKIVMIDHGYGVVSVYGHNSQNYVKEGDRIKRGEIIGSVGRTGLATGSHLHYQIEVDGVPVDPEKYVQQM